MDPDENGSTVNKAMGNDRHGSGEGVEMPSMLNAAVSLLEMGFKPIPLGAYQETPPSHVIKRFGGDVEAAREGWPKTPRIRWKEFQERDPTEEEVAHWWSKWPHANIGILTGFEVCVIDADSKDAMHWVEKNLPVTSWRVRTSKGMHYYYAAPSDSSPEIMNSANAVAKIDVRGVGGYVVAAGSTHHSGFEYKWDKLDHPVADNYVDLPELSVESVSLINTHNSESTVKVTKVGCPSTSKSSGINLDLSAIKNSPGERVKKGERNNEAARIAGREYRTLSQSGICDETAFSSVMDTLEAWNDGLEEPMTIDELANTAKSIQKTHEKNKTRQITAFEEQLAKSAVLSGIQGGKCTSRRKLPKATHSSYLIKYDGDGRPCMYRKRATENADDLQRSGDKTRFSEESLELVSGAVWVVGTARTSANSEWFCVVKFVNSDGDIKTWLMPRSLKVATHRDLLKYLFDHGLFIVNSAVRREYLAEYLNQERDLRFQLALNAGWHSTPHGPVFIFPCGRQIGNGRVLMPDMSEALSQRGDLTSWQSHVSLLCAGNSRLVFAQSVSFTSALLFLTKSESAGFHFEGNSSVGKTTALNVARSTFGLASRTWRTTDNAMESVAANHCDIGLTLDEIGESPAEKLGDMMYMLSNGRGKERLGRDSQLQSAFRWRLYYLSSGELSASEHLASEKKRSKTGQLIRLLTIPADAGNGLGIFNNLHGRSSARAFADELKTSSEAYCGHAGEAFVQYLIGNQEWCSNKVLEIRLKFDSVRTSLPGEDGQIGRAVERFSLVAAAGEIATAAGITGWMPGEAFNAAMICFDAWRSTWAPKGSMESMKAVNATVAFLLQHESRFDPFEHSSISPRSTSLSRVGFKKMEGDEILYCIFPDVFKTEVCRDMSSSIARKALRDAGFLVTNSSNETAIPMSPAALNKKTRLIVVKSSILEAANEH